MEGAFAVVIFVVVGVAVVLAVVSFAQRDDVYDQIGRGGIGDEREAGRREPAGGAMPSATSAEAQEEIRQMLEARNARRAAQGRPTVDVEEELAQLTRPAPAADPEIVEEVRALVRARNARRIARGQEPLDEEAEVRRQLRDLPG